MTDAERKKLKKTVDPFKRALAIADALPGEDAQPLRNHIAGTWPTLGDLRALVKAVEKMSRKPVADR